jgi:hypothetical protein
MGSGVEVAVGERYKQRTNWVARLGVGKHIWFALVLAKLCEVLLFLQNRN